MRTEDQKKLQKIRKVSIILRVACKGLLAMLTLGFVFASVALLVNRGGTLSEFEFSFDIASLTMAQRILVLGATALTAGVGVMFLYHLHQLFGNYSRGEIFTRGSVDQLRQLGFACVLWGVAKIVWAFMSIALSARTGNGLQINADSIPIGIVIVVVAWFMDLAVALQEENELTV